MEQKTFISDGRFYQIIDIPVSSSVDGEKLCQKALNAGKQAYIGSTSEFETIEAGVVRILWDFDLRVRGRTNMSEGNYLNVEEYEDNDSGMWHAFLFLSVCSPLESKNTRGTLVSLE